MVWYEFYFSTTMYMTLWSSRNAFLYGQYIEMLNLNPLEHSLATCVERPAVMPGQEYTSVIEYFNMNIFWVWWLHQAWNKFVTPTKQLVLFIDINIYPKVFWYSIFNLYSLEELDFLWCQAPEVVGGTWDSIVRTENWRVR